MSASNDPAASSYLSSQALPEATLAGATAHTGGFVEASGDAPVPNPSSLSGSGSGTGLALGQGQGHSDHSSAPVPGSNNPFLHEHSAPSGLTGGQGFGGASGGGLQSSPLVPAPGTSINPATGKPHTAGLTRAELEAKRAKEAASVEQATNEGAGSLTGSTVSSGAADAETQRLKELSGREQAARQLAGALNSAPVPASASVPTGASSAGQSSLGSSATPVVLLATLPSTAPASGSLHPASGSAEASTAGHSGLGSSAQTSASPSALSGTAPTSNATLSTPSRPSADRTVTDRFPGAYGSVPQIPVPGAPGSTTTSIYEDVNEALAKVGSATFAALPTSLKNALSTSPHAQENRSGLSPDAAGSPTAGRRSSVAAIFENVKAQTTSLVAEVRDTYAHPAAHLGTGTGANQTSPAGRRLSANLTGEGGTLNKVKDFLAEAWVPPHLSQTHPVASGLAAPRVSLPSEETSGAKPGEFSSGVGALPGKSTETGVAILPEEKAIDKATSSGPSQNQSFRPGEVPVAPSSLPEDASGSGPDSQKDVKAEDTGAPLAKAPEVIPAPPTVEHDSTSSSHGQGLTSSIAAMSLGSHKPESSHAEGSTSRSHDTDASTARTPEVSTGESGGDHRNLAAASATPEHAHSSADASSARTSEVTSVVDHHTPAAASSTPKHGHDESIYSNVLAGANQSTRSDPVSSSGTVHDAQPTYSSSHSSSAFAGLAPALPSTFLGTGADEGATDISAIKGIVAEKTAQIPTSEDVTTSQSTAPSSLASVSSAGDNGLAPPANDRTTSMASVTAIRHGHEGDRHHSSPLATITDEQSSTGKTSDSAGVSSAQSLTPGNESHGVGHPSTRDQEGTSREPGNYPAPDHSNASSVANPAATGTDAPAVPSKNEGQVAEFASGIPVIKSEADSGAAGTSGVSGVSGSSGSVPSTTTTGHTAATGNSTHAQAPASPLKSSHGAPTTGAATGSGHNRTSSTSSDNGGKKKSGFISKLKEKLKHHGE